ncbi:glycosyltransferase involved in cell wall biosynthesis [Caballeronia udeis]|uniref:Glycosyltransferase involved in cell wall biosynthesis n=2 Tax=Caballeronia udeis TaxID=1232866 RepID=A0ABW8ML51_9BURK
MLVLTLSTDVWCGAHDGVQSDPLVSSGRFALRVPDATLFLYASKKTTTMANDTLDTVLIVEPNFTGHRWRYAEWAAAAYMEAGYRCVIVTDPANAAHSLAVRITRENRPELQIQFVEPLVHGRSGLAKVSYVRFFRDFKHAFDAASRNRKIALVVVPYVDYFFYSLPFTGSPFGATPWVGITMRANFHHAKVGVKAPREPLVNAIKAQLFQRAIRTPGLKTLLTIDPTLTEWCTRAGHQAARSAAVQYLADPFPDAKAAEPLAARQRLGLGTGKHVLVYGAITERKGIQELVAALAQRAGTDQPTLVVAGAQDDETRAFFASAGALSPPAVFMDRFITAEEELDLFSACDVVWLGYKGHYGMSGVLVQAYRFGKPVVATADGLIGWFCRTGELGPVVEDLSVASINRAFDKVFGEHPSTAPAGPHLLERNTLSHFKQTLRQAIV